MEGTKQNRTFLSADLPSSPCNLRACWEKQQGILGKTEGGLYLIQTTSVCVGAERSVCVQVLLLLLLLLDLFLLRIILAPLQYLAQIKQFRLRQL